MLHLKHIAFALFLALSADVSDSAQRGRSVVDDEDQAHVLRRRAMENMDTVSDVPAGTVLEKFPCIPRNDERAIAALETTPDNNACAGDFDCGGGCCRIFNGLACDLNSDFSHLRCVCNSITDNSHLGPDDLTGPRNDTDTAGPPILFPAMPGDCDEPTPFQKIPNKTPCTKSSDCTADGECCVRFWCFCKKPDADLNELQQCVPDP